MIGGAHPVFIVGVFPRGHQLRQRRRDARVHRHRESSRLFRRARQDGRRRGGNGLGPENLQQHVRAISGECDLGRGRGRWGDELLGQLGDNQSTHDRILHRTPRRHAVPTVHADPGNGLARTNWTSTSFAVHGIHRIRGEHDPDDVPYGGDAAALGRHVFDFLLGTATPPYRVAIQIDLVNAVYSAYVNGVQVAFNDVPPAFSPNLVFATNDFFRS